MESLEPRQLLSATIPADYVAIGSKTVNLSNNGVTTTSINLQADSQYILKATGTGYIANGRLADADFMQGTTTQVNWQDNANVVPSADVGLGMGLGGSAAKVVWTRDVSNTSSIQEHAFNSADHTYEFRFTAASNGNLALKFFDLPGTYRDNSGSLSVTVYKEVVQGTDARDADKFNEQAQEVHDAVKDLNDAESALLKAAAASHNVNPKLEAEANLVRFAVIQERVNLNDALAGKLKAIMEESSTVAGIIDKVTRPGEILDIKADVLDKLKQVSNLLKGQEGIAMAAKLIDGHTSRASDPTQILADMGDIIKYVSEYLPDGFSDAFATYGEAFNVIQEGLKPLRTEAAHKNLLSWRNVGPKDELSTLDNGENSPLSPIWAESILQDYVDHHNKTDMATKEYQKALDDYHKLK